MGKERNGVGGRLWSLWRRCLVKRYKAKQSGMDQNRASILSICKGVGVRRCMASCSRMYLYRMLYPSYVKCQLLLLALHRSSDLIEDLEQVLAHPSGQMTSNSNFRFQATKQLSSLKNFILIFQKGWAARIGIHY